MSPIHWQTYVTPLLSLCNAQRAAQPSVTSRNILSISQSLADGSLLYHPVEKAKPRSRTRGPEPQTEVAHGGWRAARSTLHRGVNPLVLGQQDGKPCALTHGEFRNEAAGQSDGRESGEFLVGWES